MTLVTGGRVELGVTTVAGDVFILAVRSFVCLPLDVAKVDCGG